MENRHPTAFLIPLHNIPRGRGLDFSFQISPNFFVRYPSASFTHCSGDLGVKLKKIHTLVELSMLIQCQIRLTCDRTLRAFSENLTISKQMWLTWKENVPKEQNDEFLVLSPQAESLSLDQSVYDYIALAIPMQRLHPDCRKKEPKQAEDYLYSTKDDQNPPQEEGPWEPLRRLDIKNTQPYGTSKA